MPDTNKETYLKNKTDLLLPVGNTGPLTLKKLEKQIELEKQKKERKVKMKSISTTEKTMPAIPMVPRNSEIVDTEGNLIESYEPQQSFLNREISQDVNLLNESTKLLHSRTKSLLNPESEVRKPADWEYREARSNMETMARLIQVKVNMIKTLRK